MLACVGALILTLKGRPTEPPPSARSMWRAQASQLPAGAEQARLGELLVHRYGLLTEEQLSQALTRQMATRQKLGEILVQMGFVTQSQAAIALADQQTDGQPFGPGQ